MYVRRWDEDEFAFYYKWNESIYNIWVNLIYDVDIDLRKNNPKPNV